MTTFPNLGCFRVELRGWVWRGSLCALPSVGWAWALDYRHPFEVAAMLLVVSGFIVAFATSSTWMAMKATPGWLRFSRALKIAAGIKIGTFVGVAAYWTMWVGWLPKIMVWLVWPDMLLGLCSVELIGALAGPRESMDLAKLDSFALTGLTALVHGALLSLLLVLIALIGFGIIALHPKCRAKGQEMCKAPGAGSVAQ